MKYSFYGSEEVVRLPINKNYKGIKRPTDLYDALSNIWCRYSCTPRLRDEWNPNNKALGQCSITAFLVQDIFGGKVYGIQRPDGNYHCFNRVNDVVFDLTSEQFGDEKLNYDYCLEQYRDVHFANENKRKRYEFLKAKLNKYILTRENIYHKTLKLKRLSFFMIPVFILYLINPDGLEEPINDYYHTVILPYRFYGSNSPFRKTAPMAQTSYPIVFGFRLKRKEKEVRLVFKNKPRKTEN